MKRAYARQPLNEGNGASSDSRRGGCCPTILSLLEYDTTPRFLRSKGRRAQSQSSSTRKVCERQEPTREERERNPGEGRVRKGQLELSFPSSLPSLSRQTHVKASRSMTRQQNTSPTTALEEGAILCEKKANEEVGRRKTLGGERRGRASRKARAGEAGLFWSLAIGKLFLDLSDQIKA